MDEKFFDLVNSNEIKYNLEAERIIINKKSTVKDVLNRVDSTLNTLYQELEDNLKTQSLSESNVRTHRERCQRLENLRDAISNEIQFGNEN